ncbi:MAG: diguanylate cyclase [Rhodospirillales bacterium]|nr:diguanylate cyclase [Rhodospirillales bacterium]
MDVNKTHATAPVGSHGSKQEHRRDPEGHKQEDDSVAGAESTPVRPEAFAIDGLLAEDMDPKVRLALENLAGQIEPLRAEVELARGRETHFRELSEKHSFLPLSGRREFLRELAHILSHMEGLNAPALVVLHLVNGDDIRRRLGRSALDGALVHVAEIIESSLHPIDVAGNLGGNDFCLVFLAGDMELARNRVQGLVDTITSQPFLSQSGAIPLHVATGVAILEGQMTPQDALKFADLDLLRSFVAAQPPEEAGS